MDAVELLRAGGEDFLTLAGEHVDARRAPVVKRGENAVAVLIEAVGVFVRKELRFPAAVGNGVQAGLLHLHAEVGSIGCGGRFRERESARCVAGACISIAGRGVAPACVSVAGGRVAAAGVRRAAGAQHKKQRQRQKQGCQLFHMVSPFLKKFTPYRRGLLPIGS